MRELINIIEGRRAVPQPTSSSAKKLDPSVALHQVAALIRTFADWPFYFSMDRSWVDEARKQFRDYKTETLAMYAADGEPPPSMAVVREALPEMLDKIWTSSNDLSLVPGQVDREIEAYQVRAAERHDQIDNPDFFIEASDYLRAMEAMKACAKSLSHVRSITTGAGFQEVVDALTSFAATWSDAEVPAEGTEPPTMEALFQETVSKLLPLMLLHAKAMAKN